MSYDGESSGIAAEVVIIGASLLSSQPMTARIFGGISLSDEQK
jgi:hypothetical protein